MAKKTIKNLLDSNKTVLIFKNVLGNYTCAIIPSEVYDYEEMTDDFTPMKSLNRLAEKCLNPENYQKGC